MSAVNLSEIADILMGDVFLIAWFSAANCSVNNCHNCRPSRRVGHSDCQSFTLVSTQPCSDTKVALYHRPIVSFPLLWCYRLIV